MNAILRCVLGGVVALVACASVWATEPSWVEQKEAIAAAIDQALDERQRAFDAGEVPKPTRIADGAVPGLTSSDLAALARLIDERVSARTIEAAGPAAPATEPSRNEVETGKVLALVDKIGACAVDEEGNPINDARVERFSADFDGKSACQATLSSDGAAFGLLETLNPGLNDTPTSNKQSSLQLQAERGDARVSLKLDLSTPTVDHDSDGVVYARSLVFSAPVNKKDKQGTDLIGLEGLANDFDVEFNWSRIETDVLRSPKPEYQGLPLVFLVPDACRDLGIEPVQCSYASLLREAHRQNGDPKLSQQNAVRPNGEQALSPKDVIDIFSATGSARVQGFRASAGYDKFAFFDPGSLVKRGQDEVPWGVGLFLGQLKNNRYLAAGIDYQREYEAGTSVTACPADAEGPVVPCVTGALQGPESKSQHLIWAEGRWLLAGRAVSARVIHDLKSSDWDVSVPVYLFGNGKGLLTGGIRFGWTTDDEFSAGIFVGVPFKFMD